MSRPAVNDAPRGTLYADEHGGGGGGGGVYGPERPTLIKMCAMVSQRIRGRRIAWASSAVRSGRPTG